MKKWIALILTFAWVLSSVGCTPEKAEQKKFDIAGAECIELFSGLTGNSAVITEAETIAYITDNINGLSFEKGSAHNGENGYAYSLEWYDADMKLLDEMYVIDEYTVLYGGYFYNGMEADNEIDTEYLRILTEEHEMLPTSASVRRNDTNASAFALTEDEVEILNDLLEDAQWTEGTSDCLPDCVLAINGMELRYSSDCGTFHNYANETGLTLDESWRLTVNGIFETYISLGFEAIEEDPWGVTMAAEDVTSAGMNLVISFPDEKPEGELSTGSYYWLERYESGGWQALPYIVEGNIGWDSMAYLPPEGSGSMKLEINWAWLYGELPAGTYRIGKEIMLFRDTGDYEKRPCYVEFELI